MDITWYGLSCFRIKERAGAVVCDPYGKSVGLSLPKLNADIVTSSHPQPGHSDTASIAGEPKILSGPGEYEVKNIFVIGTHTHHRRLEGKDAAERNVVFFFEMGNLTVGHLGDLGQVPKQSVVDEWNVGELDILMVPVGGSDVLDESQAVELIGMLEPKIVIPMHYQQPGLKGAWTGAMEPVDKFLKEWGITVPEAQDMLKISKSSLPEEPQVVLLNSMDG